MEDSEFLNKKQETVGDEEKGIDLRLIIKRFFIFFFFVSIFLTYYSARLGIVGMFVSAFIVMEAQYNILEKVERVPVSWRKTGYWPKIGILCFFFILFFVLSIHPSWWILVTIPASAFFVLKILYNSSEKVRSFWKRLRYWQKGGVLGFSIVGVAHILFVTLDLILEGGRSITHLSGIVFEFPLFAFQLGIIEPLFGSEFLAQSDIIFWLWIYVGGTIAWGVVGAVLGVILGYLTGLSKT